MWAITTYYNPGHYESRYRNYKKFRANLDIPLLTVEMSQDDIFELEEGSADILIRIPNGSILWQKERLLNVALKALPLDVGHVCWLDCDIIFGDADWASEVVDLLGQHVFVQCFSELIDLQQHESTAVLGTEGSGPITGQSITDLLINGNWVQEDFVPSNTRGFRKGLCGLAWAAHRDVITRFGFYDALILGSGDRALACAIFGRPEDAIKAARMDDRRAEHYLAWAKPLFASVQGNVGIRPGRLFHLWHGKIENRRYLQRHEMLATLDFDPDRDIELNEWGAWKWTAQASPSLREAVAHYFAERKEDGDIREWRT